MGKENKNNVHKITWFVIGTSLIKERKKALLY